MVNVSAFLPEVTDTLLTSGGSGDWGRLGGGRERRGNAHTSRFAASQNYKSEKGQLYSYSQSLDCLSE